MEQVAITQTEAKAVTSKSFIESYIDYAKNLTDAPEIYHEFLGLNILSLAIGRTPISVTPKELYPNVWVILIGSSGVARKSSAMKLAMNILPDVSKNVLPNDFSPEALQEVLSDHSQGLIWKEEIGGFLESIKKKDYMSGMADLLCQLYDCPDAYNRRLRSQLFDLKNVCFNIISATTPSRFLDTVEPSDFNSGFQSRFLIVVGKKTFTLKRRQISSSDDLRRLNCKEQWTKIFTAFHQGPTKKFEFEESALDLVNEWCDAKDAEVMKCDDVHEADLKGAIATRMQDYLVKLSALYEVDNVSKIDVSRLVQSTTIISRGSVEKACRSIDNLLTQLTDNLLTQLTHSNVSTKLVKLTNTIKSRAEADGWTQHRILLQYMNCPAESLKSLLQTAYQRELIEIKTISKGTYYRLKATEKNEPQVIAVIATEEARV
jgi:hypothetical protein